MDVKIDYGHYMFMISQSRIFHGRPHILGFTSIGWEMQAERAPNEFDLTWDKWDESLNNVVFDAGAINCALGTASNYQERWATLEELRRVSAAFCSFNNDLDWMLTYGISCESDHAKFSDLHECFQDLDPIRPGFLVKTT